MKELQLPQILRIVFNTLHLPRRSGFISVTGNTLPHLQFQFTKLT